MSKYILAVALTLYVFHVNAQEIRRISFKEAVDIGLKNNVDIKQEENTLALNNFQKTSSLVDYLPMVPDVSISSDAGTFQGNTFIQQTGQVVTGQTDFVSGSLNTSTVLFNGLNRYYNYKNRRNAFDAQFHNVKWTKETVIGDVARQYLTCLLNKQLLVIAETNVDLQKETWNKIKEQVELGSLAEVDRINQEYQLKNAELESLRAQTTLRNSLAQLAQLLQLNPSVQIELVEPDWSLEILPDDNRDIDELIEIALQNRSDIQQARELEEASEYQFKAARGFYYPRLLAFYNIGSRYNNIEGEDNREFSEQFLTDNRQKTYGLSLSIPILNGLSTRENVMMNKVQYENQKLRNDDLVNTAKIAVMTAYQDYKEAMTAYTASESQLEAGELSYSLEKERYELGASDLIQLTEANQNYVQAQSDFAQSYYTLIFQNLLMEYALGTLTPEDIPE